jgi:hypothetical protein
MSVKTEIRNVIAVTRFRGGPGREREAAEAWAFELTYYFKRGIGEPPQVTYAGGVYTCRGIMQTTHPGDRDVTVFDEGAPPWDLDYGVNEERRARLRELYKQSDHFFDGRDREREQVR